MWLLFFTGLGVLLLGALAAVLARPVPHLMNRKLELIESPVRATVATTLVGAISVVLIGVVFVILALIAR